MPHSEVWNPQVYFICSVREHSELIYLLTDRRTGCFCNDILCVRHITNAAYSDSVGRQEGIQSCPNKWLDIVLPDEIPPSGQIFEGSAHLSIHVACAVDNLEKHMVGEKGPSHRDEAVCIQIKVICRCFYLRFYFWWKNSLFSHRNLQQS